MNASKFNPLIYANKLEAAGVPEQQARLHALALTDVLDAQMVTKADLDATDVGLRANIDVTAANVHARIDTFEENIKARIDTVVASLNVRIDASEARMEENLVQFEARIELKFEKQFAGFKNEVIKWFIVVSASQIGITTAILGLFAHAR